MWGAARLARRIDDMRMEAVDGIDEAPLAAGPRKLRRRVHQGVGLGRMATRARRRKCRLGHTDVARQARRGWRCGMVPSQSGHEPLRVWRKTSDLVAYTYHSVQEYGPKDERLLLCSTVGACCPHPTPHPTKAPHLAVASGAFCQSCTARAAARATCAKRATATPPIAQRYKRWRRSPPPRGGRPQRHSHGPARQRQLGAERRPWRMRLPRPREGRDDRNLQPPLPLRGPRIHRDATKILRDAGSASDENASQFRATVLPRHRATFGRNHPPLRPDPAQFGRNRHKSGRNRLHLALARPHFARIGRMAPSFDRICGSGLSWPSLRDGGSGVGVSQSPLWRLQNISLVSIARAPAHQNWTKFAQLRPKSWSILAEVDPIWANSAGIR